MARQYGAIDGNQIAPSGSNPKFWCSRLRRLPPSIAAALSNTSDTATCTITSAFIAANDGRRPPHGWRHASPPTGSACELIHAGAQRQRSLPQATKLPTQTAKPVPEGVACTESMTFVPACEMRDTGSAAPPPRPLPHFSRAAISRDGSNAFQQRIPHRASARCSSARHAPPPSVTGFSDRTSASSRLAMLGASLS